MWRHGSDIIMEAHLELYRSEFIHVAFHEKQYLSRRINLDKLGVDPFGSRNFCLTGCFPVILTGQPK